MLQTVFEFLEQLFIDWCEILNLAPRFFESDTVSFELRDEFLKLDLVARKLN